MQSTLVLSCATQADIIPADKRRPGKQPPDETQEVQDDLIPLMPAAPEVATNHKRWRDPPEDPRQLGEYRKALSSTMESLERRILCADALNLDQQQITDLQGECAVVLYQLMHSRSPQARVTKQRLFVNRCRKRLTDATAKLNLLYEQVQPPGEATSAASNDISVPATLAALQQSNAQLLANMENFQTIVTTLQTEISTLRLEK
ncbi:unnamed protein product [Prorocentrum cordatum]|uniref:Mediator of RNA polymerase II transcription subunit 7 n=1 Tax=Prorocentrum cordatum TaxID=2364126 RepID=A0ABN9VA15_9DINO|nr:unnamed protein product [Polarella glacialis]